MLLSSLTWPASYFSRDHTIDFNSNNETIDFENERGSWTESLFLHRKSLRKQLEIKTWKAVYYFEHPVTKNHQVNFMKLALKSKDTRIRNLANTTLGGSDEQQEHYPRSKASSIHKREKKEGKSF